jgi:hypothetical protein
MWDGEVFVVGHQNQRCPMRVGHVANRRFHFPPNAPVQISRGFIRQKQSGSIHQRPGEGGSLLFSRPRFPPDDGGADAPTPTASKDPAPG